jgi:hypothetical protein
MIRPSDTSPTEALNIFEKFDSGNLDNESRNGFECNFDAAGFGPATLPTTADFDVVAFDSFHCCSLSATLVGFGSITT